MKVALDGSIMGWGSGGIARYLRSVIPHLAARPEFQVEVLANSRHPVMAGIEGVVEVNRRLKGGLLWRSTFLPAYLKRHRPDVFWLATTNPPPWMPRPYVVSVPDLAPARFDDVKPRLETLAFRTAYRRAVTRADHVIAISEATAEDLTQLWSVPEGRMTVVPLGVGDVFTPVGASGPIARPAPVTAAGVSGPYALVVGTVEARKGLNLAVEIAAAVGPDLPVVFAGRLGFGHEEAVARGRESGCVFLAEVSEATLVELYRAAEVLLVPSLYEGFGLTPLEAMACGTPVIAADGAGSLGPLYNGSARLVEDREASSWVAAIDQVRSERERWVRAGAEMARSYSWEATAAGVARVLEAVGRSR